MREFEKPVRFPTWRGILFAAILLVASSSMHAQSRFTPIPVQAERVDGWIFTPRFAFGGSWDDNVLLDQEADQPPSDYATPLRPSVSLDYTGKRTRLSTGYDGSLVIYRTLDELTSFEQYLRASVEHRATEHVTIAVTETFNMAPTTDSLDLNGGVPFYRIGSRTNAVGGGFTAAVQRHLSVAGKYTLRTVDFDFDERLGRELRGGSSHEVDFSVDRALSTRWTVGGEYGLDRVRVSRASATEDPAERFNIHSALATTQYRLNPTLSVSGGIGVVHLGPGLTHASRTGPALRGGVTYRHRRTTLAGSYSRSYVPSFGFGGTLQNEEWSGSAVVPFARNRAYADMSVAWYNNESLEPGQPTLRSTWITGRLGYRATRWLSVEGFYVRGDQNIRRAGGQLSRNQIGFQVVTTRPLKIH